MSDFRSVYFFCIRLIGHLFAFCSLAFLFSSVLLNLSYTNERQTWIMIRMVKKIENNKKIIFFVENITYVKGAIKNRLELQNINKLNRLPWIQCVWENIFVMQVCPLNTNIRIMCWVRSVENIKETCFVSVGTPCVKKCVCGIYRVFY